MKRVITMLLSLFIFSSAVFGVSVEAKTYNFSDDLVTIILTEDATKKVVNGELDINLDYFKQYNIGVVKVEGLPYQQKNNWTQFYYYLTLNKHDHENVLKVVSILKGDSNFELVTPDYYDYFASDNPMKVTTKTKVVKYNKVKKAKQTVAPITVKKAVGKVTYKKLSGSKKLLLKANGKIVVKKGTKKGTYTAKIKVTAKGNANYKSASKTVKIKIKVK